MTAPQTHADIWTTSATRQREWPGFFLEMMRLIHGANYPKWLAENPTTSEPERYTLAGLSAEACGEATT